MPTSTTEADRLREYARTRDARLREELVVGLLPLVRSIARRYARRGEPLDDLVQVGSVGLLKAIDRFDPDRGVPFGAFAAPTITGEIRRHFRDTTWTVRPPRELQELVLALGTATERLSALHGRPPTVSELAEAIDRSVDDVAEAKSAGEGYSATSLDAPVLEDGTALSEAMGELDGEYSMVEWRNDLRVGLASLRPRERRIIALRFLGGLSQREIAARIGISQMHVSRLLRSALGQMRSTIGRTDLEPVERR